MLRQKIELRSIWIVGRRKEAAPGDRAQIYNGLWDAAKGAAPNDRAQIHMDYAKRGLRQTIELKSIWMMGR